MWHIALLSTIGTALWNHINANARTDVTAALFHFRSAATAGRHHKWQTMPSAMRLRVPFYRAHNSICAD